MNCVLCWIQDADWLQREKVTVERRSNKDQRKRFTVSTNLNMYTRRKTEGSYLFLVVRLVRVIIPKKRGKLQLRRSGCARFFGRCGILFQATRGLNIGLNSIEASCFLQSGMRSFRSQMKSLRYEEKEARLTKQKTCMEGFVVCLDNSAGLRGPRSSPKRGTVHILRLATMDGIDKSYLTVVRILYH